MLDSIHSQLRSAAKPQPKGNPPQRRRGSLCRCFGGLLETEHNSLNAVPEQRDMKIDQ